ncbi:MULTISPECIES: PTS sugar transporter subunit IIA [Cetobacterium]|uniref:Phosphoenolpyruvate-dependent sugar phosphotransferase system, EIIA 2 n=1 Tax=Cetobacterium somerae ATCC BAA-474 TaxID=1319815 RepID=U7VA55_9FUSO|nr:MULTISPECIES: PTS sugar transporter subunit IIA [Cetobacterium]ERT67643.1 phosphoenolpyruvate-dependent sugar phosphotransferase system, EIIA 2 [Cetobacterium somerae ATCC BAA-474]MBC2853829.1 PTS sugar transporter subunit IIA [Cetobacterium sp. 2G large]MCQ9625608.1 PTS sugar transporter subunit IIA [Cetobacterium somerae]MCX3067864.1 PTS sugar transporter subunit IIA [Cetobacterium somerae]UPO97840.1 PTS sugar transporter subunit IIA [Cetobacterium somerae]
MLNIVKITDYMSEELILLNLKAKNKDEALKELSALIGKSEKIEKKDVIYKALLERENLGSTGIGKGVAIPHAKTDAAESLTIAFGISKEGVDFKSLDQEKVKIFFVFASPFKDSQIYLKVLARISRLIRDENFREKLLNCENAKEVLECIDKEEAL